MKHTKMRHCLTILILLLLSSCQKQEQLGSFDLNIQKANIPITTAFAEGDEADWMGFIADNRPLSTITIPGTHDSGARHEPVGGTAKTQDLTIAEQLNIGVRFLDIRCRHYQDAFAIHHGAIYQNLNFDDVLNACKSFLNNHPNETIIMSVKPEHTAEGNTRTFQEQFNLYVQQDANLWYLNPEIPLLGDVRGKIVLLRRFGADTDWGMNASHSWGDKATFEINNGSYKLRVQDEYEVGNNSGKWGAVNTLLNESLASSDEQKLYVNFASGYQKILGLIPNIPSVSNYMNPQLSSYFTNATAGRYGIVVTDFISSALASDIVSANF